MAIKYRRIVILLATLGLWSTAVAGVVATSLFQVQDVSHTSPRVLTRTTVMDSSSFTPGALADKGYQNSYLGRQVLSLSRPLWTTSDNIVIEAVKDSSSASPTEILAATTRGYSAELNCSEATISYAGNMTIPRTDDSFASENAYLVNVGGTACQRTYNLTDQNMGTIFANVGEVSWAEEKDLIAPSLRCHKTLHRLHRLLRSIFAGLNLVIAVNSTTGSVPVRALVNYNHTRIIQAKTPTRILQVLLGCMLAFGLPLFYRGHDGPARGLRNEKNLDLLLEPHLFGPGWGRNTMGGNRFGVDVVSG
ncbi:hypothetical protein B0H13DRAFT_1916481 [Mycena leptocephala]|nr:hypothetical protein B0H13DRAFT_1916481 [Mycena leptocephala]